jgi:hypothetical protein
MKVLGTAHAAEVGAGRMGHSLRLSHLLCVVTDAEVTGVALLNSLPASIIRPSSTQVYTFAEDPSQVYRHL